MSKTPIKQRWRTAAIDPQRCLSLILPRLFNSFTACLVLLSSKTLIRTHFSLASSMISRIHGLSSRPHHLLLPPHSPYYVNPTDPSRSSCRSPRILPQGKRCPAPPKGFGVFHSKPSLQLDRSSLHRQQHEMGRDCLLQ